MSKNLPKRFSKEWWYIVGTVLFTGSFLYLLYISRSGDELNLSILLALLVFAVLLEPLLALGYELVAPNKVIVGPGDRVTKDCNIQEQADVLSGFGDQLFGRVSVRGEDWSAVQLPDDENRIEVGDKVAIIDREGTKLIIKSIQSDA